jgi:hypothetical protein
MTLDDALTELRVIQSRLGGVLDQEGRRAVSTAISDLEGQRPRPKPGKEHKKKPLPPWRLVIPPGNPLRFIETSATQDLRYPLSIDVSCMIDQPKDGRIVGEHTVAVRVWTSDETLYFREAFDAERIQSDVGGAGGKRVMLRFHFDHANPGQPGPRHHLQIGGLQHEGELCWFPDNIRVPRFCHHPLSLLMACEFVVRTFYPAAHSDLKDEPSWSGAIAKAQGTYLPSFYELQGMTVTPEGVRRSLLDRLWNVE